MGYSTGKSHRAQGKRRKGGKISSARAKRLFERDGGKCLRCGSEHDLTADHVKPVSQGGTSAYSNLQTLCRSCNANKANHHIDYRDPDRDWSMP